MEQDYHDIPALNASSISDYMRSPLHFWMHSSLNPDRERKGKTPAMTFGSLCHCLVLEPEAFDKEFVVFEKSYFPNALDTAEELKAFVEKHGEKPVSKGKKKDFIDQAKRLSSTVEIWDEIKESIKSDARDIITEDQHKHAIAMRDAMYANSSVRKLLGNGCSEQPVLWQREEGGMQCKAKLDYSREGLLIDYKTTADASHATFGKSIANFGYHRQMAWYMDAFKHKYGERPKGAIIIAQEKDLPEAIGIYSISSEALAIGQAECDRAYAEISERLLLSKWEAYPESIQELDLPRWYN